MSEQRKLRSFIAKEIKKVLNEGARVAGGRTKEDMSASELARDAIHTIDRILQDPMGTGLSAAAQAERSARPPGQSVPPEEGELGQIPADIIQVLNSVKKKLTTVVKAGV